MAVILAGHWMQDFHYEQAFGGVRCPALPTAVMSPRGGMLTDDDAAALTALLHDPVKLDFPLRRSSAALAGAVRAGRTGQCIPRKL
jgi:hypothetical protein